MTISKLILLNALNLIRICLKSTKVIMPREIITIQVGQCGNQIGYGFWDLLLKEHAETNKTPIFNDALSSFFKNVDSKNGKLLHNGDAGYSQIQNLKARAVVVDMECGVVNHLLKTSRR